MLKSWFHLYACLRIKQEREKKYVEVRKYLSESKHRIFPYVEWGEVRGKCEYQEGDKRR